MLKRLFLITLVFVVAFIACNTAAAASNTVVWEDHRDNVAQSHIYYKNLDTGKEGRVSSTDSAQLNPDVSGNLVVWQDKRDGAKFHIYYKNLKTGEGGRISPNNSVQGYSRIG